ncbi:hypothetical protein MUU72_22215 [Streptomyces sp. RS10V-4]|uniref:hypothetical protein n=1 Tax=Streptomyces rhizoryzae TaxID=2932493 RepID=UPI0020029A6B|nr:hypothetical protein [Streptomyces rhizoryzae]MCK7625783.1 hypothetical protein [Streptomyces rhizoryzae]
MLSDPAVLAACSAAAVVACCALLVAGKTAGDALRGSRSADRSQILRSLADASRYPLTPWRRRR